MDLEGLPQSMKIGLLVGLGVMFVIGAYAIISFFF